MAALEFGEDALPLHLRHIAVQRLHIEAEAAQFGCQSVGTDAGTAKDQCVKFRLRFDEAVQRPELFKGIILLDAPIIGHIKGTAFGIAKRLGLVDRITPARATRERRRDWPSTEEMIAHFHRRKIFRNFDPDCLRDYATLATAQEGGRVRLLFDPEIEYQIYRSVPHDLVYYCKRLKLPAGFIGGRHSNVVRQVGLANTRRSFRVKRIEGGHLFPFERPQAAAEAVRQLVAELLAV